MAEAAPEGDRYTFVPIFRPSPTTVAVVVPSRRLNLSLVPTGSRPESISSFSVGLLIRSLPSPPGAGGRGHGRSVRPISPVPGTGEEPPWRLLGGEERPIGKL